MKTIGLVGGVASGKSLAAKDLVDLGAVHLDADRTGHDVLAEDTEVRQAIVTRWGDAILAADKSINRAAIARHVFAQNETGEADRRFLESLLHPRIGNRLDQKRQEAAAAGKPAVVLDAPVLLEAGWEKICDVVLMIDSPRDVRLIRAKTRGWTEAEFARREASQWPIDKKRQLADIVISNNGTPDDLRDAITDFWAQFIVPAA
jgi:dephospho-CoA kinase